MGYRCVVRTLFILSLVAFAFPLFAQQTGAIHGRVTATDGSALPGVTVEARSNVLPQPRVTTTDGSGDYRLPALQPGTYTLTFSLSGMQTATRRADAQLGQDVSADVKLGVAGVAEMITVTAEATLVNPESTAIQNGLSSQQIQQLPHQQDYKDLQKLIPGVMYTQDTYRGPSAGASGQDNVYMFDGVNITMPYFGILNVDPNAYDIAQVSVVRGGAKAVDFDRAGGLLVDTVSKSGTNKFSGQLGYQILNKNFVAAQTGTQNLTYAQNRTWTTANIGGPIVPDRAFFYGSFYRPEFKRDNQANVYGPLPSYEDKRHDEFGKITFTPTQSWLINGSYRDSKDVQSANAFGAFDASTTGSSSETHMKLGTLETSWIISPKTFATLKLNDFRNPGPGGSAFLSSAVVNTAKGTQLDINNFDQQGQLTLPKPIAGNAAQNAFVQPFIDKYGYVSNGVRTGGGTVGYGLYSHNDDDFFRKSGQVGFNYTIGTNITHDLHAGFQRFKDSETRFQSSNGWGAISIPAGVGVAGTCPASACGTATPAFFVAQVSQQGAAGVPAIHSSFTSTNFELNDTIHMKNWTFNVGLLDSQDTLYGQGLAKADNLAGFVASPGTTYLMHVFDFKDMLQPRLGATWAYNGQDTVFVSAGRYMLAANSDARAASWDRNLVQQINVYFDASGKLIGVAPVGSSSGKWWQAGIKHPDIKEYMIGTGQQLTQGWSARVYTRYRKGGHYIEDTQNTARVDYNPPPGVSRTPYVPNLGTVATPGTIRNAIGSGSSYVIANLDGAFTKYYEASAESTWRSDKMTLTGSYTWSHYYGNFDQDASATCPSCNDAAVFIGSSNIGDGAGRQIWDMKYGNLRGDRRNVVKLSGTYALPWRATTGAFWVFQSGQPYQIESVLPYRALTGSTSDYTRYAEPAGSRMTPSHHQLDMNYTQNIPLKRGIKLQLVADIFNVYNKQTGYNYEDRVTTLGFTTDTTVPTIPIPASIPQSVRDNLKLDPNARVNAPYATSFYAPRRFQLAARVQF